MRATCVSSLIVLLSCTVAFGAWMEEAKLTASDAAAGDHFGLSAVSLAGDTALIGAPHNDDAGTDSGSAYVFVRSGNAWRQHQQLAASDTAVGDQFGFSVGASAIVCPLPMCYIQ